MAEVKWIKLATDIFDNRKIKLIEAMPEGDSIIVAWLKLLCLAGNINDAGMVYLTKEIPYQDTMLATVFRMPLTTIQLALTTFERFGMIEVIDDIFHISNWEKYQNADKLAELKEYNRIAQQKSRAKKKALKATQDVNDMSLTCQPCQDTDKDIDKDIDKEDVSIDPSIKGKDRMIDSTTMHDIEDQIDYDSLISYIDLDLVDMAVGIIADFRTAFTPQEFNSRQYAAEFVRQRSYEIDSSHIEHVINLFKHQHEKVSNVRGYLRTMLFNAPETMGAYYTNKVCAEY